MGEMVRYGVLPNPYTPGVLVDFYGHPISSGGGGYASLTGAGQTVTPGDLAQAGGFTVTAPAGSTEGIVLSNASTTQGTEINSSGPNGIVINDSVGAGITIESQTINGQVSVTGINGVSLNASATHGEIDLGGVACVIEALGAIGGTNQNGVTVESPEGLQMQQTTKPDNALTGYDRLYFKADDNLYALNHAGTEKLIGGTQVLTAGSLGGNVPVAGGPTVFLSTGTLQPGTYLITLGALIGFPVVNGCDIWATQGTATATLSGQIAGSFQTEATAAGGGNIGTAECSLAFKAVVTVAGALAFNAEEGGSTAVILADTFEHVQAGATGYTALQIA